jgi:hypothetical protein
MINSTNKTNNEQLHIYFLKINKLVFLFYVVDSRRKEEDKYKMDVLEDTSNLMIIFVFSSYCQFLNKA